MFLKCQTGGGDWHSPGSGNFPDRIQETVTLFVELPRDLNHSQDQRHRREALRWRGDLWAGLYYETCHWV